MSLTITEDHISAARTVLTEASARGEDVSSLWYALTVSAEHLARKRHDELKAIPARHAIDRPEPYRAGLDELVRVGGTPDDSEPSMKRKWFHKRQREVLEQ